MNNIYKLPILFQLRKFILYFKATSEAVKLFPLQKVFQAGLSDYFKWWKTIKRNPKLLEFDMPWINFSAKHFLDHLLFQDMTIYELGSGSSTIYFSKRVKKVCSREHDKDWFMFIADHLRKNKIENVNYELFEAEDNVDKKQKLDADNADHYTSSDKKFLNKNFKQYSSNIDQFADDFFDLIVVDGRNRNSCIKHALSKIKKGGYILLDNAERKHYTKEFPELEDESLWLKNVFIGPVPYCFFYSQTNFYKRL